MQYVYLVDYSLIYNGIAVYDLHYTPCTIVSGQEIFDVSTVVRVNGLAAHHDNETADSLVYFNLSIDVHFESQCGQLFR